MTQPISNTLANLNTAFPGDAAQVEGKKALLGTLRKHVEQGDLRTRITAQLQAGTAQVPFWYGPARLQITRDTQATAVAYVTNGRLTKLSIDLSKPIVLLNPVGSLVPSYIPCADILNNRNISIEGMDLTSDGHIVPRGTVKVYFNVAIHKVIPLQFCPIINTDAASFFKGKVIKSVRGNTRLDARETLRAFLGLVASYDIFSRFRPARPIRQLNIENIDAFVRGAVQASPAADEFISEPVDGRLCLTVNKRQHTATLLAPHVRVSPGGSAHIHGQVQLNRASPYAPTPPRNVGVDVAIQHGDGQVHAHSGGLLRDLDDLRGFGQPS